jgi:hypothetical protein
MSLRALRASIACVAARGLAEVEASAIAGYVLGMRFLSALLWSVLLPACGSKGSVSLLVEIDQPMVHVDDGISGSFQLSLALGSEASGSTRVTLGNFSLQTEAGAPLIDVLNLSSTPEFPVDVAKGDTQIVSFTFDRGSVDHDAVCAGKVRIVGSVMDTLKGGTDPVSSALFTPDC